MASLKEHLYWKAPSFVKELAVAWNTRRLNRERFGPAYEQALKDVTSRDRWTAQQFEEYQRQLLVEVVRHAAANVPYSRPRGHRAGVYPV